MSYEERAYRYWSAAALQARSTGRFELAVLWEEWANGNEASLYGHGLAGELTTNMLSWDTATALLDMVHAGRGLSSRQNPHADLGGAP